MNVSFGLPCIVALSALFSLGACDSNTLTGESNAGETSGSGSGGAASTGTGAANGGSTTGATRPTGSGTTTGAPAFQGCPDGWQSCAPTNICDIGCTPDGGLCVDEATPNYAKTGAACGHDAVCEGSTCMVGSGPQVPNLNQGVLSPPNIVMMTYNNDPNQQQLESWGVWIADGGFLSTTVAQYGVQNGTIQFVRLSDTPPGPNTSDAQAYLQTHFDSDPTMPPFAQNNIYLLLLPADWAYTASFCQSAGGYHSVLQDSSGNYPIYAVVPNCANNLQGDVEVAASHEIIEAATDPYSSSWTFAGTNSAWYYLDPGEVGDMCESNTSHYTTSDGTYSAQYIWSNDAAKVSQVPCQPWPADQAYFDVLATSTLVPATPGTTANIPLTGWANAAAATGLASDFTPITWALVAEDAPYGTDFPTSPTLSESTITPGGQIFAQLNIPAALPGEPAQGGKIGAAWILAATSNTAYYGSTVVGVSVSCQTNGDCANEAYACNITDAGGSCGYNFCDSSAAAFSTCSANGSDDGVCLPFDSASGGSVEVCMQAGSRKAGAEGCKAGRVVDAGPGAYCEPTALCEGSITPACFGLCDAQGNCPTNQVCIPQGQYYGFCVHECATGEPCPSGQQCYSTGSSVDICYPN